MAAQGENVAGFLPYINFAQGISMQYPPDWASQEQTAPRGFFVGFGSPPEDAFDDFSENVSVVIEPVPPQVTLGAYVQFSVQQWKQNGAQVLENASDTVAGLTAQRLVFASPLQGPRPRAGKFLQYLMVAYGKAYVFTYTAVAEKYEKFLPAVLQMRGSLQIQPVGGGQR